MPPDGAVHSSSFLVTRGQNEPKLHLLPSFSQSASPFHKKPSWKFPFEWESVEPGLGLGPGPGSGLLPGMALPQRGCQGHQIQHFGLGLFSPQQILSAPLIIPRNEDCGERMRPREGGRKARRESLSASLPTTALMARWYKRGNVEK